MSLFRKTFFRHFILFDLLCQYQPNGKHRFSKIQSDYPGQAFNHLDRPGKRTRKLCHCRRKLLFLPGTEISANTLNQLLQKIHAPQFGKADSNTVIAHLESEAFLFKDAFEKQDKNTTLPSVNLFYPLQITANSEKLLTEQKGNTLFSAYTYGSGNIYTSAFSFEPENSDPWSSIRFSYLCW